ncbi:MAG: DUF5110 domain-containing protein [Oscillospiraceae bacterium]|nr:DUF5110 domain-containing protein [Oscillospiraceae bacterium]
MENFFDRFNIVASPKAPSTHILERKGVRITVLTPCLLRVETERKNAFCDEPTQSVLNRNLGTPEFKVNESKDSIEIKTTKANFLYSLRLKKMLRIKLRDGRVVTNFKAGNLKGTCRTLDVSAPNATVGDGVCSKNGVAVLDDSDTLLLKDDATILPRKNKGTDEYYFAYGYNYIGATQDLYRLTGTVPLIPRFALSNWWSRYKAYTQEEYLSLMDRFKDEEIPISVATVDMDWHWVDIKSKFGAESHKMSLRRNMMEYVYDAMFAGWTGYSFNTDLFPDPDGFMKKLKSDGYKVTFNIHPSQGVRWYEDQYKDMCKAMGQNPDSKKPVEFDFTDKKFIKNYFEILHHPLEEKGVDFWWIDWQQGPNSKVPGLDPLWALNHYHFLDNCRNNKRGLILSRFCGAGSQRYPLGFSGDETQTWKSLDYQPWFTATASNIGYPWWSHDIGGHCLGYKDDELYLRWVQFGVFNPIMRLHSTNNEFMGKEPWNYSGPVRKKATEALRLRHKLLPYIYTMNYRTHKDMRALCEPMYYHYPEDKSAYECKNQYMFGSELMVAPITEHTSSDTNMASVAVWLPEGRFTDIFTGRIYAGNKFVKMYRDIESIPVFAKEGSIIPMSENCRKADCSNPDSLEVLVYRGNNTFTLYEDDGETLSYKDGAYLETPFTVFENGSTVKFTIGKGEGDSSVSPEKRKYNILFRDIVKGEVDVKQNGRIKKNTVTKKNGTLSVVIENVTSKDIIEITVSNCDYLANAPKKQGLIETISKYQMSNDIKNVLFSSVLTDGKVPTVAGDMQGPIEEILELYRG